jgi:hypothetical protein
MKLHSALMILPLLAVAACSVSAQPIALPSAAQIVQIGVTTKDGSSRVVKDRAVIERVLKLVAEDSRAWKHTYVTFPTPAASAALLATDGSAPLVIWVGADWTGLALMIDGKRRNVFWHPQPGTEFELRRILEIAP